MIRLRVGLGVGGIVLGLLGLAGCATEHRSLGVDAADVESVEFYGYTWGPNPNDVEESTITDPATVDEIVTYFTDMPVRPFSRDPSLLDGTDAAGFRLLLEDGTAVEVSQVFVAPKENVIIWPDGSVLESENGSPFRLYDTYAVDPEPVPATRRPAASVN